MGFFPWQFELDMHECGIGEILPAGMRTPVRYQARHVDADHIEAGAGPRESEWLRRARAESLRGELPAFWGAPEALNQNY